MANDVDIRDIKTSEPFAPFEISVNPEFEAANQPDRAAMDAKTSNRDEKPPREEEEEEEEEGYSPATSDESKDEQDKELAPAKTNASSIADEFTLFREIMFVTLICFAQLMTQITLGNTVAIIHVIGDTFGVYDPGSLSWLIAGYSLTVGSFILVAGRFGDVYGYKRMLLIGYSWFAVWSVVAGLSVYSGSTLFIFSRVFVGIGPSIVLPNSLAILGASYSPGIRKNMVFAFFGAVAPSGGALGSAFAGLFSLAWWPWTYWSSAIALVIIVGLCSYFIPDPPRKMSLSKKVTTRERIEQLDLIGAFIGVLALILINFAWNQAPVAGWSQPYVYVLLIVGILLVPGFFYYETYIASNPLIPFDALNVDTAFVLACVSCGWATFGIWYYYLWQFIEELRGVSPLLGAAYVSPAAISGALASVATGWLLGRVRPAWVMVAALTFFLTGIIILGTMPVDQTFWGQLFVATIITPWGMDMSFPSGTLILSNSVSKETQGIAASLVNTVVNYSIALSLGIAGTVELQVTNGKMTREAKLQGYRSAWYLGMGIASLGLCISITFLIRSYVVDWRKSKAEKTEDA